MSIRPVSLFILIYLFLNINLGWYWITLGYFPAGDFVGYIISDPVNYFFAYIVEVILILVFLIFLYFIFLISPTIKLNNKYIAESKINNIVFILQISYFVYSLFTGVGVLSTDYENVNVDNPVKYIFTFLPPDYMFLALLMIASKPSKSNIIIYLISNIYRGWIIGALFNLFFLLLFRYKARIKFSNIVLFFILFLFLTPSLYFLKNTTRGADTFTLETFKAYYQIELYEKSILRNLSRFQHISESYVLYENKDSLRSAYENSEYIPFYLDNQLKGPISNLLNHKNNTIGSYAAKEILERGSGGNIHVGILTWLIINPYLTIAYFVYFLLSMFFLVVLLKSISLNKMILPSAVFIYIIHFMHGWMGTYFLFIWSLFFIFSFKVLITFLSENKLDKKNV